MAIFLLTPYSCTDFERNTNQNSLATFHSCVHQLFNTKYGGFQIRSTYIKACRQDRNESPTAIYVFSRSSYPNRLSKMLYDLTDKWWTIAEKWQHVYGQWLSFMMDIAVLNTLVLWLLKNRRWYEKKHGQRRRVFLHELGMAFVLP